MLSVLSVSNMSENTVSGLDLLPYLNIKEKKSIYRSNMFFILTLKHLAKQNTSLQCSRFNVAFYNSLCDTYRLYNSSYCRGNSPLSRDEVDIVSECRVILCKFLWGCVFTGARRLGWIRVNHGVDANQRAESQHTK